MTGGLSRNHWRQILGIIHKHPNIHTVILYGSRAMGNFREGSDIDLALKGDPITPRQLAGIRLEYEDLYLPWKLDITDYADIKNADLRAHIRRVGKKLDASKFK